MGAYGKDPATGTKTVVAIASQSITSATDTNSSGIDLSEFKGWVKIVVNAGTFTGASPAMDIDIQESSDDGSSDAYADVTGASFTQITTSNDAQLHVARLLPSAVERYIRIQATSSGTITAIPIGITVELCGPGDSGDADNTYDFTLSN